MITENIFPISERRDLSKISADRQTKDFKTYSNCLAALEWAEDYIKNGKLMGISSKFIASEQDSQEEL